MEYQKKTVGMFAKKGVDIKHGDIVTIANEGQQVNGQFGLQEVFAIRLAMGEEKNITLNQTSLNNMIDAYGGNSKGWVGKPVKIWLMEQIVKDKLATVLYISHPDTILNDDGTFESSGTSTTAFDPGEAGPKDEEVKPENIPF